MPLDADIYGYKQGLTGSLCISIAMHLGLLAFLIFFPALLSRSGLSWGNNGSGGATGEAMSAHLVSGLPLPANPQAKPENVLANESKGLSTPLPAPAPKRAAEDKQAIPIPEREAKVKPKPQAIKPREEAEVIPPVRPMPTPVAPPIAPPTMQTPPRVQQPPPTDNTVPFGEGGPVAGPYTTVSTSNGAGGLKFGEGGTGSFGSLYGWYADVVARKVHQAWQSEVNPNIVSAKRVYILFDIARNGNPSHVRVEQSSGIPSLDQSALRALQRIDTFGPLPAGYNGSYVSVEFWFDYRR
jgi:periplasmic protein TonB